MSIPRAGAAVAGPTLDAALLSQDASGALGYVLTVLHDAPAVYYRLNDNTTLLNDSSVHRIVGIYGSAVRRGASALTSDGGAASSFPGGGYNAAAFTSTPQRDVLQPSTLSLEAWIKPAAYNATGKPQLLVSYGRPANGSRYGLLVGAGNTVRYEQQNVRQARLYTFGRTTLLPGSVYHVVVTSDSSTVRLYVNGNLDGAVAYPGYPDYSDTGNQGLYIGGALQSNLPTFDGEIAQVAVYPTALSATAVFNHYVAGQLARPVSERAASADAFVDSIGINTHFGYNQSNYWTGYATAKTMLIDLGIRHIRDSLVTARPDQTLPNRYKELASAGIHGLFVTGLMQTRSDIQSAPQIVGNSFEGFEAPNEQDDQGVANWAVGARTFQQQLYGWVKSGAASARFPVLGPALVSGASYAKLGDISAYIDVANVHTYTVPYNPGTPGWGSVTPYGIYGSLSYAANLVKVTSPGKPVISTETGFGTIANEGSMVDERTDLRYIPRAFFEHFNHGFARTYVYELLDEGGNASWNNFGIIKSNFAPKPAYTALKSIIGALNDRGPAFALGSLTYALSGNIGNVHHTLLQKRNGSYVLALWLELPNSNPAASGADIVNVPQSVRLTTVAHFSHAAISSLNESSGAMSTASLSWSGTQASFNVSDQITLVELTP